jgi:hypothetical protein
MLQTVLPEDPEDGQIVTMPQGQIIGGANVINVERSGKLLGNVSQIAPVYTSSGKYEALRVATCDQIKTGDILHVKGWQYNYTSLIFLEGFGWAGYEYDENNPTSLMDKHMRVIAALQIGRHGLNCYLYEKVCLQLIREGETREKSTSNPPATPSRNTTPSSSRTTPTRGSSSRSTRPNTPQGSNPSKRSTILDGPPGTPKQNTTKPDSGGK